MHAPLIPKDLEVSLTHLADIPLWEHEKPYQLDIKGLDPNIPRTNCIYTEQRVRILDGRAAGVAFGLDTTGFVYLNHNSKFLPTIAQLREHDQTAAFALYLRETMDLIKEHTGAKKVVAIDWRYREHTKRGQPTALWEKETRRIVTQPPFFMVHSDYSIAGGRTRIKAFLTEAEWGKYDNEEWRMRIINVWRPLLPVIEDSPLAFCDSSSIGRSDIVAYDKIVEDRDAENAFLLYRDNHRWYWMPEQKVDEPAMFVVWDSLDLEDKGLTGLGMVPHSAFRDPTTRSDAPPRESFETQFIVITRREPLV